MSGAPRGGKGGRQSPAINPFGNTSGSEDEGTKASRGGRGGKRGGRGLGNSSLRRQANDTRSGDESASDSDGGRKKGRGGAFGVGASGAQGLKKMLQSNLNGAGQFGAPKGPKLQNNQATKSHINGAANESSLSETTIPKPRQVLGASPAMRLQEAKERRAAERKKAIADGFLADPDRPRELKDAITPRGTCADMCPEYERLFRIQSNDVLGAEFSLETTNLPRNQRVADEARMVKRFQRSAAGMDEQLPSDLRPPLVLRRTCTYLFDQLVSEGKPLGDYHHFLWDRTRAIRNDFSIQQVSSVPDVRLAMECLERIVRFHIISLHDLGCLNPKPYDMYDYQQDWEQCDKALLSLTTYYDKNREKYKSPNEAEFRAYWILFRIQSRFSDMQERIQRLPREVLADGRVRTAFLIFCLAQNDIDQQGMVLYGAEEMPLHLVAPQMNWVHFFKLVGSSHTSFLMACCAEVYFTHVRKNAIRTMLKAYRKKSQDWTTEDLAHQLGFDNTHEVVTFAETYGLNIISAAAPGKFILDLNSGSNDLQSATPSHSHSLRLVEVKRFGRNYSAVINGMAVSTARARNWIDRNWQAPDPSLAVPKDDDESLFIKDDTNPPKVNGHVPPSFNPFAKPFTPATPAATPSAFNAANPSSQSTSFIPAPKPNTPNPFQNPSSVQKNPFVNDDGDQADQIPQPNGIAPTSANTSLENTPGGAPAVNPFLAPTTSAPANTAFKPAAIGFSFAPTKSVGPAPTIQPVTTGPNSTAVPTTQTPLFALPASNQPAPSTTSVSAPPQPLFQFSNPSKPSEPRRDNTPTNPFASQADGGKPSTTPFPSLFAPASVSTVPAPLVSAPLPQPKTTIFAPTNESTATESLNKTTFFQPKSPANLSSIQPGQSIGASNTFSHLQPAQTENSAHKQQTPLFHPAIDSQNKETASKAAPAFSAQVPAPAPFVSKQLSPEKAPPSIDTSSLKKARAADCIEYLARQLLMNADNGFVPALVERVVEICVKDEIQSHRVAEWKKAAKEVERGRLERKFFKRWFDTIRHRRLRKAAKRRRELLKRGKSSSMMDADGQWETLRAKLEADKLARADQSSVLFTSRDQEMQVQDQQSLVQRHASPPLSIASSSRSNGRISVRARAKARDAANALRSTQDLSRVLKSVRRPTLVHSAMSSIMRNKGSVADNLVDMIKGPPRIDGRLSTTQSPYFAWKAYGLHHTSSGPTNSSSLRKSTSAIPQMSNRSNYDNNPLQVQAEFNPDVSVDSFLVPTSLTLGKRKAHGDTTQSPVDNARSYKKYAAAASISGLHSTLNRSTGSVPQASSLHSSTSSVAELGRYHDDDLLARVAAVKRELDESEEWMNKEKQKIEQQEEDVRRYKRRTGDTSIKTPLRSLPAFYQRQSKFIPRSQYGKWTPKPRINNSVSAVPVTRPPPPFSTSFTQRTYVQDSSPFGPELGLPQNGEQGLQGNDDADIDVVESIPHREEDLIDEGDYEEEEESEPEQDEPVANAEKEHRSFTKDESIDGDGDEDEDEVDSYDEEEDLDEEEDVDSEYDDDEEEEDVGVYNHQQYSQQHQAQFAQQKFAGNNAFVGGTKGASQADAIELDSD